MEHLVAHAVSGTLLFHTWTEGVVLYERLVRGVPGLVAACVMPDHLHVQVAVDPRRALTAVTRGYARWRNARRGERGSVFRRLPPPQPLVTPDKVRRSERYIHLNPCRGRLAADPLAWPLSTYRDVVGVAVVPAVRAHADPARTHAYTSGDPTVEVAGTLLPGNSGGVPTLDQVRDAVCSLCRAAPEALRQRGPARSLFVRAARVLTAESAPAIAAIVGVHRQAIYKVPLRHDREVQLVAQVCGDHRFHPLWYGDLRSSPKWWRYRHHW